MSSSVAGLDSLRARTVAWRGADPLDLAGDDGFVWGSESAALRTSGTAATVPLGLGPLRLTEAALAVEALLAKVHHDAPSGAPPPVAVGALPFDDRTPGALVVPAWTLRRGPDGRLWETRIGPATARPSPTDQGGSADQSAAGSPAELTLRPCPGRVQWEDMVRAVLRAIAADQVRKVVLARTLTVHADRPFRRDLVLRRLRAQAPGCYLYAAGQFVGASPELLVRRDGNHAVALPLAGTTWPDAAGNDLAARGEALAASTKDLAEHRFLADAVVAALGAVATRVHVRPRHVMRLATVAHLATRVDADLAPGAPSALGLAGLLHPTPAIAGVPTTAAVRLIEQLEPFDRGRYAGPVGWVDAHGDGEWALALRGAELDGNRARLVAGAGIVAGSDPATEWDETEAKLAAALHALGG